MTDKDLPNGFSIDLFQQGNYHAFEHIYHLHKSALIDFAYTILKDKEESFDITTETFIKLLRLRSRFETLQNIKAFLYVTNRNACIDRIRRGKKERDNQKELSYFLKQKFPSTEEMISPEIITQIIRALEKLPKQCRQVIEMSFLHELRASEIALKLGISSQSVYTQKNLGLNILRQSLGNLL